MSFLKNFNQEGELDLSKLGVDEALMSLLYDIAILGMTRSYFVHTQAILDGYLAVRPNSELATLGMGLLGLARSDYNAAAKAFSILVETNPKHDIARAYLGLTLKCKNEDEEAKKVLDKVVESATEPSAIALAKATLEQIAAD